MNIFNKIKNKIIYLQSRFFYKYGILKPQKKQLELHEYWRNPKDVGNYASMYEVPIERSNYLLEVFKSLKIDTRSKILEIGCNTGRNLNFLFSSGFLNLYAIEISTIALKNFENAYPKTFDSTHIFNGPVENHIEMLENNSIDIIFTMVVLTHIHDVVANDVFYNMARVTKKYIILIEDEFGITQRNFPRNYKSIFEKHNMLQIKSERFDGNHRIQLGSNFVMRVFKKL